MILSDSHSSVASLFKDDISYGCSASKKSLSDAKSLSLSAITELPVIVTAYSTRIGGGEATHFLLTGHQRVYQMRTWWTAEASQVLTFSWRSSLNQQYRRRATHSNDINLRKLVPCGTDGPLLLSGFQALVTLTLDRVIWHTVVHHSLTSIYTTNFIEIGKSFCGRTSVLTDISDPL